MTAVFSGVSTFTDLDLDVIPVLNTAQAGSTATTDQTLPEASGTTFVVGQPGFALNGTAVQSVASSASTARFLGFVKSIAAGSPRQITFQTSGIFDFGAAHGFTAPALVWLRQDVCGITATAPTTSGTIGMQLGYVIDSTKIAIMPQQAYVVGGVQFGDLPILPPRTFLMNASESSATPSAETAETAAAILQQLLNIPTAAYIPPSLITGSDIDMSAGVSWYKNIAANATFNFLNKVEGKPQRIRIGNTSGSTVTATFSGVVWPSGQPTIAASTSSYFEVMRDNGVDYGRVLASGYALDTAKPTAAWSINATGDKLQGVFSEPVLTPGGPTNVSLGNLTPAVTLASWTLASDGLSGEYTISRVILASEAPNITIGAMNNIKDAAGNEMAAVTGGTVANGSTQNSLWLNEQANTTTLPAGITAVSSGQTYGYAPAPEGAGCIRTTGANASTERGYDIAVAPAAAGSEWWYKQILSIDSAPTAESTAITFARASDNAAQHNIRISPSGVIRAGLGNNTGGVAVFTPSAAGVPVYVWYRRKTDGSAEIYASETDSRPATPQATLAVYLNGTTGRIRVCAAWSAVYRHDWLRGSNSAIA